MIFKNDKKYELTQKDKEMVLHFVGKFPARLQFPEHLFTESDTNKKRKNRPRSVIIPFEEILETENGTEKWNYTRRPPQTNKNGDLEYYQDGESARIMSGNITLTQKDNDFLFFLITASSIMAKGKNCKTPYIEIHNAKAKAVDENIKTKLRVKVESYLFGDKLLHPNDLHRIAMAFGVAAVKDKDDDIVINELHKAIDAREKDPNARDGYKHFLDLVEDDTKAEQLGILQDLKDANILKYNAQRWSWVLLNDEGKIIDKVAPLIKHRTQDESLEYAMLNDEAAREKITETHKAFLKKQKEVDTE